MRYYLIPLGCATNRSDSERIAGILESLGYTEAQTEEQANIIGIVACSIRQTGIDRIFGKARNCNKRKKREHLITFVSGCILPADEKKFTKIFDFVVKLGEIHKLPELLNHYGITPPRNFWHIKPRRSSFFKALIPIQNGCNNFCAYCAVPYTRGREISRPSEEILKEITQLIRNNVKQITLLGQNVNSYGKDNTREISFVELLEEIGKKIEKSEKKIWVHFTSPHPKDMNEEIFEVMTRHRSLAPYLNLPLQSGSNRILKRMNRRYTVQDFFKILELARKKIPDLTVTTDIIVGFCGETLIDFNLTKKAMQHGQFDMGFIAQYSSRGSTLAHKHFKDDVGREEKKRRDVEITKILAASALKKNQKMLNTTIDVLFENPSRKPGKILGRSIGLKSIECSGPKSLIGSFKKVKITNCESWRLYGEVINTF